MANIAPRIKWRGDKFNHKGPYSKDTKNGYFFYQTPTVLTNYLLNTINGNCGNQLKLMWILMGSAENFGISEKMIIQRTGMTQQAYCNARKALNDAGIIDYNPSEHTITIDYDYLWKLAEDANNGGNYEERTNEVDDFNKTERPKYSWED